jgi:hypothetical protein
VNFKPGEDPNYVFLRAAAPQRSAILWIYDVTIRGTEAVRYPPRISALDPNYVCRNFGRWNVGVVACVDKRSARGF